jgi:hypothetical protein
MVIGCGDCEGVSEAGVVVAAWLIVPQAVRALNDTAASSVFTV